MQSFLSRSAAAALSSLIILAPTTNADPATKSAATAELPGQEYNVYRSGQPHRSTRGTDSISCQTECNIDETCASWAYVAATLQTGPRCELKRTIGPGEYRPGSISGVSSRYYPNGNVRPKPAMTEVAEAYPPAGFAPYPGSENWPAPYDYPVDQQALLGGAPLIKYKSVPTKTTAKPKPPVQQATAQPLRSTSAHTPAAGAPMSSVITQRPATSAPKIVYKPVIASPPPASATPTPVAYTAPSPKPTTVPVTPPTPTPPSLKLRKNWTDPDYGAQSYSVQDTNYIPGDEEATGGFLEGAPE
ncbi:MAG: hypothetical protein QNI84_03445 [Henriciella sp.]|nr:hypothetical protein [Henriciella sp.]